MLTIQQLRKLHESRSQLREVLQFLRDSKFESRVQASRLGTQQEQLLSQTAYYSMMYGDELRVARQPADTQLLMFLLSGSVPVNVYHKAIPEKSRAALEALGLIQLKAGRALSQISIAEYEGALFLSDRIFVNHAADKFELITTDELLAMPPHLSSLKLLSKMSTITSGSLLDVGCGSGFFSQVLGRGLSRVVGMDISERCVLFSAANAALNGLSHCEYLVSDLNDYTAEPFDNIVFNSPSEVPYEVVGLTTQNFGDRVVFNFVNERLSSLLQPDGLAQIGVLLYVPRSCSSAEEYVRSRINDARWQVRVALDPNTPFELPPSSVEARKIPPGSWLLRRPEDRDLFWRFVEGQELRQISFAVLSISPSGST